MTSRSAAADALDEPRGLVGVGLRREHAELVAALADDRVLVAHGRAQRVGDLAQQLVADRVAERVVDGLEAVEVEHEHATAAGRCGGGA